MTTIGTGAPRTDPAGHPTAGPPDITIAGLGMVAVRQITAEVQAALRRSNEILYLDHGFGIQRYLAELCPRVTDLYPIGYRDNEPRLEAYDRMSTAVLQAALDHPPVTLAIYGHPRVYVYPTTQITAAAPLLDLRVEILPGISSLDTMFLDLGLDPGLEGLQLYEATDLLVRERPLQPDVPCLLWQVGAVGSSLYSRSPNQPARFEELQRYLLRYYPAEHEVRAVHSSGHPLVPSEIVDFPLSELPDGLCRASPVATLYLPPTGQRPVRNAHLSGRLESLAHLRRITGNGSQAITASTSPEASTLEPAPAPRPG